MRVVKDVRKISSMSRFTELCSSSKLVLVLLDNGLTPNDMSDIKKKYFANISSLNVFSAKNSIAKITLSSSMFSSATNSFELRGRNFFIFSEKDDLISVCKLSSEICSSYKEKISFCCLFDKNEMYSDSYVKEISTLTDIKTSRANLVKLTAMPYVNIIKLLNLKHPESDLTMNPDN